jgi:uncharacterized protein YndB with AHSA1/START domain
MTVCQSDPVKGGRYHYVLVIPEYGPMAWHGNYLDVDRPGRIDAEEWFVMGDGDPDGAPTTQTLTFEAVGDDATVMTMVVNLPEPEDPQAFMEESAAGLTTSLATLDELVSG